MSILLLTTPAIGQEQGVPDLRPPDPETVLPVPDEEPALRPPVSEPPVEEDVAVEEDVEETPPPVPERRVPVTVPDFDATPDLRSSTLLPPAVTGILPDARRRPLQLGAFAISPTIALGAAYDDNVNADNDDREDDITTVLAAALSAQSLFARHSLSFEVNTDFNPSDDNDALLDLDARAAGRLDLTRRSSLGAELTFIRGTESSESQEAGDDTTVTSVAGAVTYARQQRRLGWRVGGRIRSITADEDGLVDEDDVAVNERDRISYGTFVDANYRLSRRLRLFADTSYAFSDYDVDTRDSQSIRGDVGVSLAIGRALSAQVGVGYSTLLFDDPEREDVSDVSAVLGLDGVIRADRYTTVRLDLNRDIDPAVVGDAASATSTEVEAGVTRLLSRASAVTASVGYTQTDFNDIERIDHDVVARLGYRRTLTQNIDLNVGYRFSQRFSDEEEDEFLRNVVSVALSATF